MTKRALFLAVIGSMLFSFMLTMLTYGEQGQVSLCVSIPLSLMFVFATYFFSKRALLNPNLKGPEKSDHKHGAAKIVVASFMLSIVCFILLLILTLLLGMEDTHTFLMDNSPIVPIPGAMVFYFIIKNRVR